MTDEYLTKCVRLATKTSLNYTELTIETGNVRTSIGLDANTLRALVTMLKRAEFHSDMCNVAWGRMNRRSD